MKHIVLFGAGKSATVLIDYLKNLATQKNWLVTVVDGSMEVAQSKTDNHNLVKPVDANIQDDTIRRELISKADIVISLMPPHLHYLIALDCLEYNKHLLTASYIDEDTKKLAQQAKEKGILFLYEMGLDPGIDHISAMEIIHNIQQKGGVITSFISHCGGLVAPESDDNPWHYKISWNPRNVVMAGKAGATFLKNDETVFVPYENLFTTKNLVEIKNKNEDEVLAFYPNRDSLGYIKTYGLDNIKTFIRTTLRHPNFCLGWKNVVDLKLTNEDKIYDTNGLSIQQFFKIHNDKNGFSNLHSNLSPAELEQLTFLGLDNDITEINIGLASAADILQFILEKKLVLNSTDKDMIVMLHEFEYVLNGKIEKLNSLLRIVGESNTHTAMAKTVGLPLGIAAQLILEGNIKEEGLHIPILPSIYEPVLKELKNHNISFYEYNPTDFSNN